MLEFEITDKINELKKLLIKSINKNSADGLLFSGGLDTSILAALCDKITLINISLEDHSPDLKYAKMVEKYLNSASVCGGRVHYYSIKTDEAINSIPEIIKILRTFDPAIPNDIVIYFGMKIAKKLGLRSVMTGDGADELFAGYDYMQNISDLKSYIYHITRNMYFSSNKIGELFKIKVVQPYMDKELIDFLLTEIPIELKIRKENGKIYGKWILRKAFEDVLPKEIIWQNKRPLEFGSGMSRLREIISSKISDSEFKQKSELYPIKFINKEHLYYYEIYIGIFGKIPGPDENQIPCPGCGAGIKKEALHCRTCGWVKRIL